MRLPAIFATIALSALLVTTGCSGTGAVVQKGIDRYERLDYPGAAGEFSRLSGRDDDMNNKGLVRYYVYNGLTAYHLGYRAEAYRMLTRGKALHAEGTASWIKPKIVAEMDAALANLSGAQPVPVPVPAPVPGPVAPAASGHGPTIIILPAR
ncbi:MAG: hypothetical protein ACMG6S_32940 [Byssovorax sp.]